MKTLQQIIEFTQLHHAGQFRRDGITPYFNHLQDVASRVEHDREKKVAFLHDILEDTTVTPNQLEDFLATDDYEVYEAVVLLTKPDPNCDYFKYVGEIKNNSLAREVKIADMISNLQDKPTRKQVAKYGKAMSMLASRNLV